jgi:hypothetical protein
MSWPVVLDALEASLRAHAAIADGADGDALVAPPILDLPDGMPPLPPELVGRASALLTAQQSLIERLAEQSAPRPARRSPARRLDQPAARHRFDRQA